MKIHGLLLTILAIGCFYLLNAQVIWQLEITHVSQQNIQADLHVTNNLVSDINWSFGDPSWVDLFVDGNQSIYATLPMVFNVFIPAGGTITEHIGYSPLTFEPPELIPPGTHTAQARRRSIEPGDPFWTPVGNIETVTVYSLYHFINFDIQPESINQDSLSFIFNMTNTDVYTFNIYYAWDSIRMTVDGNLVSVIPQVPPGYVIIPPDSTYSRRLVYNPANPIKIGTHLVSFAVQNLLNEPYYVIPEVITVTVEPTLIDEEIAPVTVLWLSVYPNPFNSNVNISFESKSNTLVKTSIFNIKGQLVKSFDNNIKSLVWDGRDNDNKLVSNGVYLIKATQDEKSVSRKVIRI